MADAIRKATETDLAAVKAWLRKEEQETSDGFFCHWSIIAEAFGQQKLFVLAANDDIFGFVVDATHGPDILEIRPDARRNGYGRRLAE